MQTDAPTRELSVAQRLIEAGVGYSHAYMIVKGARQPSLKLAAMIYRKTRLKFGPLAHLSDRDADRMLQLTECA